LAAGAHVIDFLATDIIGHQTAAGVTVMVDNSAPSVQLISPAANVYLAGMAVFRVRAFDEEGLASVVLHLSGQPDRNLSLNTVSGYHEFEIDTRGIAEGVHTCWAEATDLTGKSAATAPLSFQVDNQAPKLEMRYPPNGILITGRDGDKLIDANPTDTFLSDVLYNIDGGQWTSPALPFTAGLSDGTHSLTLRAYDIPGRFTEVSVEFRFDATPPALSVVFPQSEPRLRGVLRVAVSASDLLGIGNVSVAPDAATGGGPRAMAFNPVTGLYEAEFDTALWQGGDRTAFLTVTASDNSGYTTSASLSAFVDNSAPVILKVLPNSSPEGTVEFRFNVTDSSPLSKVLFRRDGGEWKELTYSESKMVYYALWKTSLADNGAHVYEIKAVDSLGNERTASYSVTVANKDYSWVAWVILLVLVVLVVAYVAISRRQKPREEAPAAPEPARAEPVPPVESPFSSAHPAGERPPANEPDMPPMPPAEARQAPTPPPEPKDRPAQQPSAGTDLDKLMADLEK